MHVHAVYSEESESIDSVSWHQFDESVYHQEGSKDCLRVQNLEELRQPARHQDPITRWRLRRLSRLIKTWSPHFRHGAVVPALAIGLRLEERAARVFQHHRDELNTTVASEANIQILSRLAADETRHVAACRKALASLVSAEEMPHLLELLREATGVEQSLGAMGALAMHLAGVTCDATHRIRETLVALGIPVLRN